MKKFVISFLLIIINTYIFANFADIDTLRLKVVEKTRTQGREKVMSYDLVIKFPDLIYKEVLTPALNRGEKYIYKENKKIVYIPLLQQFEEYEMLEQENQIFNVIDDIKNIHTRNIKYTLNDSGNIEKILYRSGNEIILDNYKDYEGIFFPSEMIVLENNAVLAELSFSDIEINMEVSNTLFQIDRVD